MCIKQKKNVITVEVKRFFLERLDEGGKIGYMRLIFDELGVRKSTTNDWYINIVYSWFL